MKYAIINGISIAYEIQGKGESLILIHGGQGDSNSFNSIIPSLVEKYCVLYFDQRGSGYSDKPDIEYTIEQIADDTAELMKHVGFDKAHIFGVSMGGLISEALAIRYPEKIKTLILGCTLPGGYANCIQIEKFAEDVYTAFSNDENIPAETRAKALANVAFTQEYLKQNPEIIQDLINERNERPINKIGLSRRLAAVDMFNAYDKLNTIQCPTLIITGNNDMLVNCKNSQIIAKQISHSELVTLDSAGHIFWTEQKDKTITEISKFINKHQ